MAETRYRIASDIHFAMCRVHRGHIDVTSMLTDAAYAMQVLRRCREIGDPQLIALAARFEVVSQAAPRQPGLGSREAASFNRAPKAHLIHQPPRFDRAVIQRLQPSATAVAAQEADAGMQRSAIREAAEEVQVPLHDPSAVSPGLTPVASATVEAVQGLASAESTDTRRARDRSASQDDERRRNAWWPVRGSPLGA